MDIVEEAPNAADVFARFGPIPLWRIRFGPSRGTATEQDVLELYARGKCLCELVDGFLIEKTTSLQESYLAARIGHVVGNFAKNSNLGIALGANGMVRLAPGLVRIPDVSYFRWERFPDRRIPNVPFAEFAPDLAVEVLSPSNTAKEMSRKLNDYFKTGVRLVWYVDAETRTVEVFTAVDRSIMLHAADTLDGGEVLPGFTLPLSHLFEELAPNI